MSNIAELIYSEKCENGVTYMFYGNSTYKCKHWHMSEVGVKWKVEDGDVFISRYSGEWNNVSKYSSDHDFITITLRLHHYIHNEIDKVLLGDEDE